MNDAFDRLKLEVAAAIDKFEKEVGNPVLTLRLESCTESSAMRWEDDPEATHRTIIVGLAYSTQQPKPWTALS